MVPHPTATSFHFCEKLVFEHESLNATLVNTFFVKKLAEFPGTVADFLLYVVLSDGLGTGTLRATVSRLETDEDIFQDTATIHFAQRFAETRTAFDFRQVEFYTPGAYLVTLDVDGEPVAERKFYIIAQEATA